MADSPDPDSNDDTRVGAGPGAAPGAPRWAKVFGLVALVLVVLVILVLLIGGGNHGPGRHLGRDTPPSSVTDGHTPPEDVRS